MQENKSRTEVVQLDMDLQGAVDRDIVVQQKLIASLEARRWDKEDQKLEAALTEAKETRQRLWDERRELAQNEGASSRNLIECRKYVPFHSLCITDLGH